MRGFMTRLTLATALVFLSVALCAWQTQSADDLPALNAQVEQLSQQGGYAAAIPMAKKAIEIARQQHGANSVPAVAAMNELGELLRLQARHAEARQVLLQAITATGVFQGRVCQGTRKLW